MKQHGSAGARDNKGEQTLEILSDVDLVMSHYLEMLIEILRALIYDIDCEGVDCSSPDYKKIMVMFEEIFKEYNALNRQDECETCSWNTMRIFVMSKAWMVPSLAEMSMAPQRVKVPRLSHHFNC